MGIKRNSSLEGLRGFSALIVLLGHFCAMFYPAMFFSAKMTHLRGVDFAIGQTPLQLFINGNTGVVFFLLLTGYGSYQVYNRGIDAIRKYLVLRYFKLLLLVIVSSIGIIASVSMGMIFYKQAAEITLTTWLGEYEPEKISLLNSLANDPLLSLSSYNTALWTMKYMFVGAGISLLLSAIIKKQKRSWLIILLAIFIFWNLDEAYYISCVFGVYIAEIKTIENYFKEHKSVEWLILLIGLYLAAYPTFVKPESIWYRFLPWSGQISIYYHFIGASFIMVVCLYGNILKKIMESKLLQLLGKYSSAIYATHIGIIVSISGWVFLRLIGKYEYNAAAGVTAVTTMISVFILAMFTNFVLQNLFRWLDTLYRKIFNT